MLCNICGKEFEPKHFNQKMCSEECKQQARRNSIEKYKKSELDLLDFDAQKRKKVKKARQHLFYTIEHLKIMQESKDSLYTIDKAIEDIKWCFDELEDVEHKYDYDKLPKDI